MVSLQKHRKTFETKEANGLIFGKKNRSDSIVIIWKNGREKRTYTAALCRKIKLTRNGSVRRTKNDNAYRIPLNIYRKWFWFTIAADCWTCVLATLAIQNEKKATNKKWGAEEKSMRNKRVHMCVCPRSFFCSVLFHFLQMNQRSWSGNQKQLVLWTKLVDKMTQNEMCASGTPTHVRTYVRTHNTHSLVHK